MLTIFKSTKRLQAERNAAFQSAAVTRQTTFVREDVPAAGRVEIIADVVAPIYFHVDPASARRLDLNPANYLNGDQFGDARGSWKMDYDGCYVLVVTGSAKNVALWLAAYDR